MLASAHSEPEARRHVNLGTDKGFGVVAASDGNARVRILHDRQGAFDRRRLAQLEALLADVDAHLRVIG